MNKEFKVGLLIIITFTVLYLSLRFAKGTGISFFTENFYYTVYDKGGILVGDPVYVNGLRVGKVHKVNFMKNVLKVKVKFSVSKEIKLDDKTIALLARLGSIISSRNCIKLIFPEEKGKEIISGATLIGKIESGLVEELKESTLPVLSDIRSTSALINEMTSALLKNTYKINSVISNLEFMSKTIKEYFEKNKVFLDKITKNLSEIVEDVSNKKDGIKPMVKNINRFMRKINSLDFDQVSFSISNLNKIIYSIKAGENSLGLLLKEKDLYNNSNDLIKELNKLIKDFKSRPSRYISFSVFGRRR